MTDPRTADDARADDRGEPREAERPVARPDARAERRLERAITQEAADERIPATERILRATARGLVERGAATLSMQEVADSAGVSKGLIHYHYHDKAALLVRVVTWMTGGLVTRESHALDHAEAPAAVDALWQWLDAELQRGDIRALIELAYDPAPGVREAVREASRQRRETAASTIESLFSALALRPRVPVPLLADVFVSFVDGLAFRATVTPEADRRVAFDVFWLALLSLAE